MYKKWSILILASAFLLGCDLQGGGGGAPVTPSPSTAPAVVETEIFKPQTGGTIKFSTNDPSLVGSAGKTYFSYDPAVTENGAFDYAIGVSKASGDQNGGFGLVFERLDGNNFWFLNIDVNGYYHIGKVIAGTVTNIFNPPWQATTRLAKGYGTENIINIKRDVSGNYQFFANGYKVLDFTEGSYGVAFRNGAMGIDAVIMPSENFPATPVSVTYRIISPTSLNLSAAANGSVSRVLE